MSLPSDPPKASRADRNEQVHVGVNFADRMLTAKWTDDAGWQRPVIRPYGSIPVMPSCSSLNYGLSIFDACKAYRTADGRVGLFRVEEHLKRLRASAYRLTLPSIPENFLQTLLYYVHSIEDQVPSAHAPNNLYLRILLFSTAPFLGIRPPPTAMLVVIGAPVQVSAPSTLPSTAGVKPVEKGLRLMIETEFVRAFPGGLGSVKASANYAAGMFSQKLAKEKGLDFVLWLSHVTNTNGETDKQEEPYITEAGVMNVFFAYRQRKVITPPLDDTILPGVTRKSAIALLTDELGYSVEERRLTLSQMLADIHSGEIEQVFASGTAAGVFPVDYIHLEGAENVQNGSHNGDMVGNGNPNGIHLAKETTQSVSYAIRSRMQQIQQSSSHRWMTMADEHEMKMGGLDAVVETECELTAEDLI